MPHTPRVSVITTVRDGGDFVASAIESTLAQSDPDWEMIIIDDGSTDDTWAIISGFADPRIRAVRGGPIGRATALNLAVAEASGEYLAVLDADDRSLPHRHRRQADFLDSHPEAVWVGSAAVPRIDADGSLVELIDMGCRSYDEVTAAAVHGVVPAHHSTIMARRSAVLACGGYDRSLPCGLDHDLLIRLLARGRAANLDEPVALKRIHDAQHFWGPRGVAMSSRHRFLYKRRVQRHAVHIVGAKRRSTLTVPLRSSVPRWLRRRIRPLRPVLLGPARHTVRQRRRGADDARRSLVAASGTGHSSGAPALTPEGAVIDLTADELPGSTERTRRVEQR